MCKLPVMRAPLSGNLPLYCSRAAIKPGISCSASSISLRPNFTVASLRSFTWKGTVLLSESPVSIKVVVLTDGLVVEFVAVAVTGRLQKVLKDQRRVRTSAFIRLSGYMDSLHHTCGYGNLQFARIRYPIRPSLCKSRHSASISFDIFHSRNVSASIYLLPSGYE